MRHYLTSSEAAIILETLEKLKNAADNSPTMMKAIDIERHALAKCKSVINKLKK
jgi:hypothetical protein